jgi:hypothetical protein
LPAYFKRLKHVGMGTSRVQGRAEHSQIGRSGNVHRRHRFLPGLWYTHGISSAGVS